MGALADLIAGWAGFFALTFHGGTVLALFAAAGFTAVRVANHRSRRTAFRLSLLDPFQWGELLFFGVLLVKGLWG
jgi:hypothetical protein